MKAKMAVQR